MKMIDQTWRLNARCRGIGPDLFFSERGEHATSETAMEYCNGGTFHNRDDKGKLLSIDSIAPCPVRTECLEFALSFQNDEDTSGIFGGTSPNQRRKMRSERAKAAVADTPPAAQVCVRCSGTGLHVTTGGHIYPCICKDGIQVRCDAHGLG